MESALLGFMAMSGLLGHLNLKNLELHLEAADEIYDGLATLIRVRIDNRRRWLPAFLLDLSFADQSHPPAHLPVLKPGTQARLAVTARFAGRGDHLHHRLKISSSFPINFFVRHRLIEQVSVLTVFPRPVACCYREARLNSAVQGQTDSPRKGLEGEISQIGNYQGNEPLKMIHWKLSARHDQLKIKQHTEVVQPPVEISLLDLPGHTLEAKLRCAAWLINDLLSRQQPVGLKLTTHSLPAALGRKHKISLLTELAHYGQN